MNPTEWTWVLVALALACGVAVLVRAGLRGGNLSHEQVSRFVCPRFGQTAESRITQDVRTGQWKRVESCSVFANPAEVLCDQECARLMNLGWRLQRGRRAPAQP